MNMTFRVALMTAGVGLALGLSAPAKATGYYVSSNAVDKCQAFTPGVTNTIRNRVIGAENVGANAIAVACNFELAEVYGGGSVTTDDVHLYFKNGGSSNVTVSCSLLPGNVEDGFGTVVSDSVELAADATGSVDFAGPWQVFGIGVTCNLPPHVTITETLIRYQDAN
jgi:hypothetical protein